MQLPNPNEFSSVDEFVSAFESLGRSIGAKPLGPACIGLFAAKEAEADFWWSLTAVLRNVPSEPDDTIADVLKTYWHLQRASEDKCASTH